jgi:hypothetical protein
MTHPLDHITITSNLFYPRKTPMGQMLPDDAYDGQITVADGIAVGYRFYTAPKLPVLVFFHGNGEIASDYDMVAPFYRLAGLALLVLDYRGYGWSDGYPLTTRLLPDALAAVDALPAVLAQHDADTVPLFLKGRSLGSAPAVYCAQQRPQQFKGLILESGFADVPSLFGRLGILIPSGLLQSETLPLSNTEKLKNVTLPLLVIHGENDTLLPLHHGQALYAAAPSTAKRMVVIPNGGHNDLIMRDTAAYFGSIKEFVEKYG